MKWLVCCVAFCLLRHGEGGALKCVPNSQDPSCSTNLEEKGTATQTSKDDSLLNEKSLEVECLSGSEWESNCYSCKCTESGRTDCQRIENCNSGKLEEPFKCKPGSSFQRGCSTCFCTETGLAECPPCDSTKPKFSCVPDTVWKNDCNTCRCIREDYAACTRMECVKIPGVETQTAKQEETSIPKHGLSRNVRAVQEPPKTCKPGQEFRMDCNKCLCDNEGRDFSCTRIDCNAVNNNYQASALTSARTKRQTKQLKCNPGEVFSRDCNVCRCSSDGYEAACTLKFCPKSDGANDLQPIGRRRS